jgi:DNA-binding transcriptional MerR regulator
VDNKEYFSSINEVSKRLGVPAYTLRYWEKQFPTAVRPTTGAGGRRYYRTETVDKLFVIKDLLYTHGMTIAGVKKMLRDGTLPRCLADMSDAVVVSREVRPSAVSGLSSSADVSGDVSRALKMLSDARALLQ